MSAKIKVQVAVRVRPFNKREKDMGTKCCVDMDKNQTILKPVSSGSKSSDRKTSKTFAFDHCFLSMDANSKKFSGQEDVFNCLGTDILDNSFEGYNACIFAYGQTGSGKSYTMMGTELDKGIIPKLCDALFERIGKAQANDDSVSFKVEVSYMEIYNEKVKDLLYPKGKQNLKVREHKIYGPYVDGLSKLAVSSFQNIDGLMSEGNKSRTVAATNMNSESSRSHAVFNITVTQTITDVVADVTGEKVSKISLVDLAGSERVQKTGSTGDRLREGSNINKSLTTLGLVISALADQAAGKKKNNFVPYRDSVLTWLLKDSLGGNSKTVMVATISPAMDNYEETLSTLRYADRAKRIVNHAVVNEDPNARIIFDLREEVTVLRNQLIEAESMKADNLKERLAESEKLIQEMTLSWEDKLQNTEQIHKERQSALEKMGISVQTSGIKVERDRVFLVNLNSDPSLNELLVYYLKDHTVIGRPDMDPPPDIQLTGLGIMPLHCTISVLNEFDVCIAPMETARICVNGSHIQGKTALRHGDRILLGNYHFFRINCPRPPGVGCSESPTLDVEPQTPETMVKSYDFDYAQNEVAMQEMMNDPVAAAMQHLESQHQKDKEGALAQQREQFEQELASLRKQILPQQQLFSNMSSYSDKVESSESFREESYNKWANEREELFRHGLSKLREEVVKANALVTEANLLAEEMGKHTEFRVTLQIPACNLSANRRRGSIVSEPAIQVNRRDHTHQIWSVEKLENKIIDMRDMYNDRKEKGLPMQDKDEEDPLRKMSFFESQEVDSPNSDPFYESQESHCLIGVANIFLEVLFHDVSLEYAVPIISQQGEVAGKLQMEIQRISNTPERAHDVSSLGSNEGLEESEAEGGLAVGAPLTCRVKIMEAVNLPHSLAHFVFCQYSFWGQDGPTVVPPFINPDLEEYHSRKGESIKGTMKFHHSKEFTVSVTEDFIEHALEGSLAVEVWGHRIGSNSNPYSNGWEVDNLNAKSRTLADRWSELIRKIEMWVEIQELNDQGEYCPVECSPRPDPGTGGTFQIRQGQSRRVYVSVNPVPNSGTLPLICESITSVSIGSICVRKKIQKGLDSYQENNLNKLRDRWSDALMMRREYLDEQINMIMNKKGKTREDSEREASLINQWVSLTEERNAVLVPAPNSGVPGSPAHWDPPDGMEPHIPVLFLELNADEMGTCGLLEGMDAAGYNSTICKEISGKQVVLPIVKFCEKDVSAIASWDSSLHDSVNLNRVTSQDERIYLIVRAVVQLSHPASMELVLRKRICLNVYKKQSFTESLRRKMGKVEHIQMCGVTYEIVANIPKASEDPEDRESLALMAASANNENGLSGDGETYIEKYTKGVSAVESILALDRLRQEVIIKEKLTSKGRMRKTSSVPNFGTVTRGVESSPSINSLVEEDFRILRSESLRNLSPGSSPIKAPYSGLTRPRSLTSNDNVFIGMPGELHSPDLGPSMSLAVSPGHGGPKVAHYPGSPTGGHRQGSNTSSSTLRPVTEENNGGGELKPAAREVRCENPLETETES
ncbi:kinesin-like protein KIF13A isoform X3 [Apostichopus japonicus]|uniref:kinesin-like protein KIF13A isoform X3 n=1 Tax=Stichopus japonicus TaxID=307972 RepID=UPI003AB1D619